MEILENLMVQVAKIINSKDEGTVRFTSLDMLYANGQTKLHPEIAKRCNFQKIGGRATGTYAFKTGFFGLTILPPEIHKFLDKIHRKIPNSFAFIDNILIVTKGNKEDHMKKVDEVFRALVEAGIRLKVQKYKLAQTIPNGWVSYYQKMTYDQLKKKFKQPPTS